MDNLLLDISSVQRGLQKVIDRNLKEYNLGSGQFLFILMINEHEGISMNELTEMGNFDKGTVSKTISKLVDEDYIIIKASDEDRRIKHLYTTSKASHIMNDLYQIRKQLTDSLLVGMDIEFVSKIMGELAQNTKLFFDFKDDSLKLGGLQKISLVDYPNEVACTVFTSGCNFKCPFCHNKDLVFVPSNTIYYEQDEVLSYLEKRKKVVKAVCISGGEPCIQSELLSFIEEIKNLGYLVKLDTNGYFPNQLQELLDSGCIDYVAMDIKNSKEKYAMTVGLEEEMFDIKRIEKSMKILKNSTIDYEFRTTIIKEYHTLEDIEAMSKWLKGERYYFLQSFVPSENVISDGLSAVSDEELNKFKEIFIKQGINTIIRGG